MSVDFYGSKTYVTGIQMTGPSGKTWLIKPQPGNLTDVEGSLSTNLGEFSVAYNVGPDTFTMQFQTPVGTSGSLMIPTFSRRVSYSIERLDGNKTTGNGNKWSDEAFVGQDGLEGGSYRVEAQYS